MGIRILGVGHSCQDYICTIEEYPKEDSSTHILDIDCSQGGGAAATAMVAASRLGIETGMIANLGDDDVGKRIIQEFIQEGVDTSCIRTIPNKRSSTSYVMVDPKKGTRTKFPYRDNLPEIDYDKEIEAAIAGCEILHIDSTHYSNAMRAAVIAKKHNILVSMDACTVQQDNKKNIELLDMVDVLITNEKYPRIVTGEEEKSKQIEKLEHSRAKIIVITDGRNGCFYYNNNHVFHMPAYKIDAIDTTGAGDTFHGAFLAHYINNRMAPLEEHLIYASATSALKCLQYGGRAGIPTHEQVIRYIESHEALTVDSIM